jgi:hypothetical protein
MDLEELRKTVVRVGGHRGAVVLDADLFDALVREVAFLRERERRKEAEKVSE